MSLFLEWCKCDDYRLICKYIWAMKMIVDEEFPYLLGQMKILTRSLVDVMMDWIMEVILKNEKPDII